MVGIFVDVLSRLRICLEVFQNILELADSFDTSCSSLSKYPF